MRMKTQAANLIIYYELQIINEIIYNDIVIKCK